MKSTTNQFERFSSDLIAIYNTIIKPTYHNFVVIVSFILLLSQLIAIFLGIQIVIPPEYRFIAIGITISLILISFVYYWVKFQAKYTEDELIRRIKRNPQDPTKDITQNLTIDDVNFAVYCLTRKISLSGFLYCSDGSTSEYDAEKNLIVGIDRGGAIVGGLLGKSLGLAVTTLSIFYAFPVLLSPPGIRTAINRGKYLDDIDFTSVKKVLLVDDAVRTGQTMEEARKILDHKKEEYNFEYRTVSILYNPYHRRHFNRKHNYYIYKTHVTDLKLPWDKYEDSRDYFKEFEEICDKIKYPE